ncbi:hypothetical protein SBV1_850028 [Verrucomicrobia bacterium]|nr:hypothetical protein SBV1_850028 [Verrucomicrobiota bacterium]
MFRRFAGANVSQRRGNRVEVLISQMLEIPLSLPALAFPTGSGHGGTAGLQNVKKDDGDLRPAGEAIDQFEHLERTPGNIEREQDSFGFHTLLELGDPAGTISGRLYAQGVRAQGLPGVPRSFRLGEPRQDGGESRRKHRQQRHEQQHVGQGCILH